MKHWKSICVYVCALIGIVILGFAAIKSINLNQDCVGHLKRAADANTIELAQKELSTAISYLEENNMTEGYTSVIYKTPDEDVKFFYDNLVASQKELNDVMKNSDQLTTTNTLMKLRETLTDTNSDGKTVVTRPDGLQYFPNNVGWAIARTLASIALLAGAILAMIQLKL